MDLNEEFTRLWAEAQPSIASYIHSLVANYQVAEDLTQDVAVLLLRKFSNYDHKRPFAAWAIGFARFEVLQSRRKFARSFIMHDSELAESLASTFEAMAPELDERRPYLQKCLEKLPKNQRESLRLRYEEGLEPQDIADKLERKAGAVRTMLSRIRMALQACIQQRMQEAGI